MWIITTCLAGWWHCMLESSVDEILMSVENGFFPRTYHRMFVLFYMKETL